MIGKTKIELFDESGKLIHEQKDKNMLTNAFKYSYEIMANMAAPYKETNIIADSIARITQQQFFDGGGILLFKDKKVEDANIMVTNKAAFAYGGSNYSNTEADRGSLNTTESKDIVIDGRTIGRRFVWDFPTHCANGQFQCVCLTHKSYGDKSKGYVRLSNYTHEDSRYLPMIGIDHRNKNKLKKTISLGMNGTVLVSNDDRFKIIKDFKFNLGKPGYNSLYDADGETIVLPGFRKLCKVIDDSINNLFITCGYSTSTGKWHIIKLDRTTKQIVEDIELTNLKLDRNGVDRTYGTEVYDFGIAGEFFIYNPPAYKNNTDNKYIHNVQTYNITSQKQSTSHNVCSTTSGSGYEDREFYWIGTVWTEDGYECFVSAQASYYSDGYFGTAFINHKNERYLHLKNNIPMNIGVLPHSLTDNAHLENLGFGFAMRPIYTINNLDRPVEKTEANTMKVTYEIIWDELVPEIEEARLEYFEEGTGIFTIAANGLEPENEYIAKIVSSKGEANVAITADKNGRFKFGINHSSLTDNFVGADVTTALYLNGNKVTSDYKLGEVNRPVVNRKQIYNHANGCYYQNYIELSNHVMLYSNYDFYASGADTIKCEGSWIRVDGNDGKYTISYKHKYQSENIKNVTIKYTNKSMSFSPNAKNAGWNLNINNLMNTLAPLYGNHRSLSVSYQDGNIQEYIKCDTMYDSTHIYANGNQTRYKKDVNSPVWTMIEKNESYVLKKEVDGYYIADALHSPDNDFCRYYDPYYEKLNYYKETFRLDFITPDNKSYANYLEISDNLSLKYLFSNGTPTFANDGFTFTEDYYGYAPDGTFVDRFAANTPQSGSVLKSSKFISGKINKNIATNRKLISNNGTMHRSYIKALNKTFYSENGIPVFNGPLSNYETKGHWEIEGGVLKGIGRAVNSTYTTTFNATSSSLNITYDLDVYTNEHYFEIYVNNTRVLRETGTKSNQVFNHDVTVGDTISLKYVTSRYSTSSQGNFVKVYNINTDKCFIGFSDNATDSSGATYAANEKCCEFTDITESSEEIMGNGGNHFIFGTNSFYEAKIDDVLQLEFDADSSSLFEYEDESILEIGDVIAVKSKDVEIASEKIQETSNCGVYKFTLDNFNNFGSVDGFEEV